MQHLHGLSLQSAKMRALRRRVLLYLHLKQLQVKKRQEVSQLPPGQWKAIQVTEQKIEKLTRSNYGQVLQV